MSEPTDPAKTARVFNVPNLVTMAKPGPAQLAGKQTIVMNKPPGATTLKNAQGQQIIVMSTAGGLKQIQTLSTNKTLAPPQRPWTSSTTRATPRTSRRSSATTRPT